MPGELGAMNVDVCIEGVQEPCGGKNADGDGDGAVRCLVYLRFDFRELGGGGKSPTTSVCGGVFRDVTVVFCLRDEDHFMKLFG